MAFALWIFLFFSISSPLSHRLSVAAGDHKRETVPSRICRVIVSRGTSSAWDLSDLPEMVTVSHLLSRNDSGSFLSPRAALATPSAPSPWRHLRPTDLPGRAGGLLLGVTLGDSLTPNRGLPLWLAPNPHGFVLRFSLKADALSVANCLPGEVTVGGEQRCSTSGNVWSGCEPDEDGGGLTHWPPHAHEVAAWCVMPHLRTGSANRVTQVPVLSAHEFHSSFLIKWDFICRSLELRH